MRRKTKAAVDDRPGEEELRLRGLRALEERRRSLEEVLEGEVERRQGVAPAVAQHVLGRRLARGERLQVGPPGVESGERAVRVALDEAIVQIGGDDAEPRAQLEDVPAILAEDADRSGVGAGDQRILLQRQQLDECRLARPVRPENGGVLAGRDA